MGFVDIGRNPDRNTAHAVCYGNKPSQSDYNGYYRVYFPVHHIAAGYFLIKEPFDKIQLVTFGIIWIRLYHVTIGEVKEK